MSGHNKWSQIKHKKAATDAKKSNVFSKLARQITLAAKESGGDSGSNANLRMLMEKAKAVNMPITNIEKAVKKGTGELEGAEIKGFLYEAYGPDGIAILIEGATDSTNRTSAEIKHLLAKMGVKWAESGSVSYLFDRKGVIGIDLTENKINKDSLEMTAIDAGAQDIRENGDFLEILTAPDMLDLVLDGLKEQEIPVTDSFLGFVPKMELPLPDEKATERLEKIIQQIEEHDDVNEVFTNAKL